jgi:hypothetical protein
VENQHRKITGYRELSEIEIAAMNEIKGLAERVGVLVGGMDSAAGADHAGYDKRWIAIARTHLQEGFMALTRAVAKPTTF